MQADPVIEGVSLVRRVGSDAMPGATAHVPSLPVRAIAPRAAGPDDDKPGGGDPDGQLAVKPRTKPQRPSMYKVLLLNDDYTPMEFVVHVLERFFGLRHEGAVEIMLTVHRRGLAVVGVFSYEIAETKVTQVMDYAQQHQHPLQCTMEKE